MMDPDPKDEADDPMLDMLKQNELDPGLSDEEFEALVRGESAPPKEEVTAVDDESKKPAPDPEPVPEPEPEPKVEPSLDPAVQTLMAEIAELRAQLAAVAAKPAEAPKEAEPDPYRATIKDYSFAMPPELVEALSDEDAAKRSQALSILIARTGEVIHNRVVERVAKMFDDKISARENAASAAKRAEEISNDFYSAHPDLNKPELAPVVNIVAQQVYKETGTSEWSASVRDAIAARVRIVLGSQGVGAPAPTTQQQPKAPALVATRGRGPAPAALPPDAALIAQTFDL